MLFVGFTEVVAVSWMYKREERTAVAGTKATLIFDLTYFVSIFAGSITFVILLQNEVAMEHRVLIPIAVWLLVLVEGLGWAYSELQDKSHM